MCTIYCAHLSKKQDEGWEMGGMVSWVGKSMEPYALGQNTCLAEISDLLSGVYETLQGNNSNQEPFEELIQLFLLFSSML